MDPTVARNAHGNKKEITVVEKPKPNDFESFVPWACKTFCMSTDVLIARSILQSYLSAKAQKPKLKRPTLILIPKGTDSEEYMDNALSTSDNDEHENKNRIMIESYYDSNDNLVQLKFSNNKFIPRRLMQVIALAIPFQTHLNSITINSGLNKNALYELSKFLPISQITELCLDYTFISEANYHVVLSANKLKHLSLAKCKINDAVVKLICDQLTNPAPASHVLSALNLSSNRITDDGAKYITDMLRVNRQLSYLNLANNMITDEGGMSIFNVFKKFPLHASELTETRARYVDYLKQKLELIDTITMELQESRKHDKIQKRKMTKSSEMDRTVEANILRKAELMAENKLGVFCDAFSANNTVTVDAVVHSLGNNSLCYLNLAYNSLSYISLKKLHEVLSTQKMLNRKPKGLVRVVIEGNLMPVACPEFENINNLLETFHAVSKTVSSGPRKKATP